MFINIMHCTYYGKAVEMQRFIDIMILPIDCYCVAFFNVTYIS